MFSCIVSLGSFLVALTLYILSKDSQRKRTKTVMEVWTIIIGGVGLIALCSALTVGV